MNETPFFMMNSGRSLFAMLHQPASAVGAAWVFSHPFFEEKLWTHRVFVEFARTLARQGDAVLRFDYAGNGDSDGDLSQTSVETALADLRCAMDEVRRRTGVDRVNLLGLRFGATLAAVAADRSSDVDKLVLWSPIVDGERYLQELLRINVATQTAVYKEVRHDRAAMVELMRAGESVNVDGYEMGFAFYSEASAIKLNADTRRHEGPCLIAQIDRQTRRQAPELLQLAAAFPRASLVAVQEEPFWKEIATSYLNGAANLFTATLEWAASAER